MKHYIAFVEATYFPRVKKYYYYFVFYYNNYKRTLAIVHLNIMYINVNAVLAKIEMLQNFHFSQLLSILLLLNITAVLINAN